MIAAFDKFNIAAYESNKTVLFDVAYDGSLPPWTLQKSYHTIENPILHKAKNPLSL